MSEPIAHVDDLRLALSELLDEQAASVPELYHGLIGRCGYGEILEVVDVLEALDDLSAWGWARGGLRESATVELRYELTESGRRSRKTWAEDFVRSTGERWSLDHDDEGRIVCILADGRETAERVLRWWMRMNPGIAAPEESQTLHEIGAFRSRSGARAPRGVRLVCRYFLLC